MLELEINPSTYRALEAKAKQHDMSVYAYVRKLIKEDVL